MTVDDADRGYGRPDEIYPGDLTLESLVSEAQARRREAEAAADDAAALAAQRTAAHHERQEAATAARRVLSSIWRGVVRALESEKSDPDFYMPDTFGERQLEELRGARFTDPYASRRKREKRERKMVEVARRHALPAWDLDATITVPYTYESGPGIDHWPLYLGPYGRLHAGACLGECGEVCWHYMTSFASVDEVGRGRADDLDMLMQNYREIGSGFANLIVRLSLPVSPSSPPTRSD